MPSSPQPSQPSGDPQWTGTVFETDEDIQQAMRSKAEVPLVPKPAQPAAKPSTSAKPYHPLQRPPIALLTLLDDGKSDGEVVRLRTDRFFIGRTEGNLLIPHDQQISARHLEIARQRVGEKYGWLLTDLQSSNGLFIRVSRTALTDRIEFLVGMGRYRFEAPGSNLAETLAPVPAEEQYGSTNPLGVEAASLLEPGLVELAGGKVLWRMPLMKPEYWIGSDPACSICRNQDPFIEPRNVRLYREANGVWHVQSSKTINGLWLRVPQIIVTSSCSFQIGEQRFRLNCGP